jgi:plasmid maintenance system antidote protein VapI
MPKKVKPFEVGNPHNEPISDVLRRAIEKSGSRYKLAKASLVSESVISRFVNRKATLNLATADRLARNLKAKVRTVDIVKLRDDLRKLVKTWFREKSRKNHPDRGGSNQAQAIVNECNKEFLEMIGRLDFRFDGKVYERSGWEMQHQADDS